jgi:hypothetical protein
VVGVAVASGFFDHREHAAHRVHQHQQPGGDLVGELEVAVAEPAEQALADVSHPLEVSEGEEAGGALDRVDRAEHAREHFEVTRRTFQGHEVAVELIQILVALDEELVDDFAHLFVHAGPAPVSRRGRRASDARRHLRLRSVAARAT